MRQSTQPDHCCQCTYQSEDSGNLYAFVCERSSRLVNNGGRTGFIVPIALVSVTEAKSIRNLLKSNNSHLWTSSYAIRPAKLFEGVEQRLTIVLGQKSPDSVSSIFTTKYNQWNVNERPFLFQRLRYTEVTNLKGFNIPKISSKLELSILEKLQTFNLKVLGGYLVQQSDATLFFHRTPGYWIRMMNFEPFFKSPTRNRSIHHIRELFFNNKRNCSFAGSIGSSSMFFHWFFAVGNCRNLTLNDVKMFPIGEPSEATLEKVSASFDKLMIDFNKNSSVNTRGVTSFQEFDWGASKPIIDEIDRVLAKHYGFTDEELDFIINYDIKYRMGRED